MRNVADKCSPSSPRTRFRTETLTFFTRRYSVIAPIFRRYSSSLSLEATSSEESEAAMKANTAVPPSCSTGSKGTSV